VDGDTAVIGARNDDDKGANSGSAYVFVRSGSSWAQQAKLTASDGVSTDQFGISVSVDGDTAVIGTRYDDDKGADSGSTYVFLLETDGDGVADSDDLCPDTLAGPVDANGCSNAQVDFDADGICDPDAPSSGPNPGACTGIDNCPTLHNPLQTQTGNNVGGEFGDACVDPNADISGKADVSPDVEVGTNTTINQGVIIAPDVVLGDDVTVNRNASIGEGTVVGDGTVINQETVIGSNVIIGANVTLGRKCKIADNVMIGDNTVIGQGCIVGDGTAIGANVTAGKGVTILADVPPGTSIPKDTIWGP
jgi:carbonic anhydrase/acetyltransferase-like protein (isoleucine patch superfamily)